MKDACPAEIQPNYLELETTTKKVNNTCRNTSPFYWELIQTQQQQQIRRNRLNFSLLCIWGARLLVQVDMHLYIAAMQSWDSGAWRFDRLSSLCPLTAYLDISIDHSRQRATLLESNRYKPDEIIIGWPFLADCSRNGRLFVSPDPTFRKGTWRSSSKKSAAAYHNTSSREGQTHDKCKG